MIATETLKITSNNPLLLSGIMIILAAWIILYVVLWTRANLIRRERLILLRDKLDKIHDNLRNESFRKFWEERHK